MYKVILNNLSKELKLKLVRKPQVKRLDIKHFGQIGSIELTEAILTKKLKPSEDPKWKETGAESIEEYVKWHDQICGIACLKMILFHKFKKEFPIITLAKKCKSYGGYIEKENDMDGLFYQPFCELIKDEFNLDGSVCKVLSLNRIKSEISKDHYIIVSVHPDIRDFNNPTPTKKGGHLVLMTGYDDLNKKFYLNNSSGFHKEAQKDYEISYKDFKRFYASRGIIVTVCHSEEKSPVYD